MLFHFFWPKKKLLSRCSFYVQSSEKPLPCAASLLHLVHRFKCWFKPSPILLVLDCSSFSNESSIQLQSYHIPTSRRGSPRLLTLREAVIYYLSPKLPTERLKFVWKSYGQKKKNRSLRENTDFTLMHKGHPYDKYNTCNAASSRISRSSSNSLPVIQIKWYKNFSI